MKNLIKKSHQSPWEAKELLEKARRKVEELIDPSLPTHHYQKIGVGVKIWCEGKETPVGEQSSLRLRGT